jgi:hypothetical protein
LTTANGKAGVLGLAPSGNAVVGISDNGTGVFGKGTKFAGAFEGNVTVTGDIQLVNGDLAEDFTIAAAVDPGTVMVLDDHGRLKACNGAYDKRVVGVISGAGNYRPAIVLDRQECSSDRAAIALVGKAFCKVDATFGAIGIGDLLTTSPTPGHAMRAIDPVSAFGTVIGKALRSLESGRDLVPILIALQ